jgi:hypothetical protein
MREGSRSRRHSPKRDGRDWTNRSGLFLSDPSSGPDLGFGPSFTAAMLTLVGGT